MEYSQDQLKKLVTGLKIFRFCKAIGGHANDSDQLSARIDIKDEKELIRVFKELDITLERSSDGDDPFESIMAGFPKYLQPCHLMMDGAGVFIWVYEDKNSGGNYMLIDISDPVDLSYDVSEEDFDMAKQLEKKFAKLKLEFTDPPVDNERCLCPKYNPDIWK
ncbi:MAG: hypothetical protein JW737_04245 [Acidobacteria bacterium]|nr:hypothetical protein [Acidobacteriota bacterium]